MSAGADGAARLYIGRGRHRRTGRWGGRFEYRILGLLTDVARRAELSRLWPLLGHNRPALLAFHDRDHGPRDGSDLGPWIGAVLRDAGIELTGFLLDGCAGVPVEDYAGTAPA